MKIAAEPSGETDHSPQYDGTFSQGSKLHKTWLWSEIAGTQHRVVEVISLFFSREPTFLLLRMKYERKMKRKLLVNSMETTKRDSM